ncbi:MAG: BrnT family toxin [Alphaproteobacteria bacterium]|nr:BrnT family toxin [Alphaproteobacteria bacterium]
MNITFDPAKRAAALRDRGLDFADASKVFATDVFEIEDNRFDYGERRIMCFGMLDDRLVVVGYVQRGESRHIFTMRKANDREKKRFGQRLGQS